MSQPHLSTPANNLEKRPFQFSIRSLFGLTFIVALLCSGFVVFRSIISAHWEPVENRSEWPMDLQYLLKDADQKRIKIEQIKVYDLKNRGAFSNVENFWRMESSPGLLDLLTESWDLLPINKNNMWAEKFNAKMPDDWRFPNQSNEVEYFASKRRLEGGKSALYVVMNDKTHKQIFVWYYFNF